MIKKNHIFFYMILMLFAFQITAQAVQPEDIISEAAVLIDADTGQILFEKNANKKMYPASTTKIMTGLLATEHSQLDEMVLVSDSAVRISEPNSANIALSPGETLSVDSAMYALMLPSANDAANALAEHVAGSQAEFVKLMNQKAREIGAFHTQYQNAHGLHEPDHFTTAYDLAMITRYAMKNGAFMNYFGTATQTIPATNLQPLERPFTNGQYMLVKETRHFSPDVVGGKVGYTTEARHTMSSIGIKNGRALICVVLSSPHRYDKFKDTQKLLDYGFDEFNRYFVPKELFESQPVPIMRDDRQVGSARFYVDSDYSLLLHQDISEKDVSVHLNLPDSFAYSEEDTISAEASVLVLHSDGHTIRRAGSRKLLSEVVLEPPSGIVSRNRWDIARDKGFVKTIMSGPEKYFLLLIVSILLLFVSTLLLRHYQLQKRRKMRQQRLQRRLRQYSR